MLRVMHFIAELDSVFGDAARVTRVGGMFAFTTRQPVLSELGGQQPYECQTAGEFEIYSHAPAFVEALLKRHLFGRLKVQKCFVGEDVFLLWVARKES